MTASDLIPSAALLRSIDSRLAGNASAINTALRAAPLPISAAALPLPTGAATEATLASVATEGVVSALNSTTTPLGGGATFTGTWEDVSNYGSISVAGVSDVAGTLYADFSPDGTNADNIVQITDGLDGTFGIPFLTPARRYFRLRVVNGSTPQSYMRVQTMFNKHWRMPVSRLLQGVDRDTSVLNMRVANDIELDTSRGQVGGRTVVHKFGYNPSVAASSTEAVTFTGAINFPTAATTVRIKSGGNANDTAAGTGARSVTVVGLDSDFNTASETLETAGASASSATSTSFWRVFRAYVETAGAYAGLATGANAGNITIENSAGGTDIITIAAGAGQTQYSGYTVPDGYTAYLASITAEVSSSKSATVALYQRQSADTVSAPYSSKRLVDTFPDVLGHVDRMFRAMPAFPGKTDLWAEASTGSGSTAAVSVTFDLILVLDV